MTNKEKANIIQSSLVGQIGKALRIVKSQLDYDAFDENDRAFAGELCLIVSEVFALPPYAEIQIEKQKLQAKTVQEIYRRLSKEHCELVLDNFRSQKNKIQHRKSYMRTALYNVVFEYESYIENLFQTTTANR